MVSKVPHSQGKRAESTCELMDGGSLGRGELGYERFCIRQYFPGLPSLGIIFKGDDWNGPIRASSTSWVKGPIYRCFENSLCSVSLNVT